MSIPEDLKATQQILKRIRDDIQSLLTATNLYIPVAIEGMIVEANMNILSALSGVTVAIRNREGESIMSKDKPLGMSEAFETKTESATTKISKKDGEYCVKLYIDGVYQKGADYFTDDKEDAEGTAKQMILKAKKTTKEDVGSGEKWLNKRATIKDIDHAYGIIQPMELTVSSIPVDDEKLEEILSNFYAAVVNTVTALRELKKEIK